MTNSEAGTRVPLFVRAPWIKQSVGLRTPALSELVDLYPTISELAGLSLPSGEGGARLGGVSLSPVMANPSMAWPKVALSQVRKHPSLLFPHFLFSFLSFSRSQTAALPSNLETERKEAVAFFLYSSRGAGRTTADST